MSNCERCGADAALQAIVHQTHGCMHGADCPSSARNQAGDKPGVWICHSYDMGPTGVRVFATEVDALRASQTGGYFQTVKFLPYGEELT